MSEPAAPVPVLHIEALPRSNEPVHVAVRRMRWFRQALRRYLDRLEGELGCRFEIDDGKVAGIFVRWLRAVEAQKPLDPMARRSFFEFAAGLMLREMTGDMPLRATGPATAADPHGAAAFWPEGYACTMFCIAVTSAAMAQEFDAAPALRPSIRDLRIWWSFRENAAEDPRVSIAFLDLILGRDPDWAMPEVFSHRMARELAAAARAAEIRS